MKQYKITNSWTKIVDVKQSVLSTFCIGKGQYKFIREIFNHGIVFDGYLYVDGAIYYLTSSLEKAKKVVLKNPFRVIPFLHRNLIKVCKEYLKLSQRYFKINFREKDSRELEKIFEDFIQHYEKVLACLWVPIVVDPVITKLLEEELEKKINPTKDLEKYHQVFRVLTSSLKETEVLRSEKDLLKIVIQINQNPHLRKLFTQPLEKIESKLEEEFPKINLKIFKYLNKYSWLGASFLTGEYKNYKEVLEEIKKTLRISPEKELKESKDRTQKVKASFPRILKELKPNKRFLKIINLAQEIIFLRTFRLECVDKGTANFRLLLEEIGKRFKLSWQDLAMFLPEEIISLLKNEKFDYLRRVRRRKKGYTCLVYGGKLKWLPKRGAEKLEERSQKKTSEFKGQTAQPGLVTGRVKLVFDKKELIKVQEGDIFVAKMTIPDFFSAMKKASAIITDIGGITCHAAIISRELNKPCIIGTKIATKVLHDGDLVEVDANKGIVKIFPPKADQPKAEKNK